MSPTQVKTNPAGCERLLTPDPILDDLFHGCAFAAFIAEARAVQGWPDPEKTRRRAYRMYEEELAKRTE